MKRFQYGLGLACLLALVNLSTASPRLNEVQVIGTHNSYHLEPGSVETTLIRKVSENQAKSLAYSHPPLSEQLDMGIRQFELDLYPDPDGGRYAKPAAFAAAKLAGIGKPEEHDPEGALLKPGIKVLHHPDFDFRTTVLTLKAAIKEIASWSEAHPNHHPIMVLLELKGGEDRWSNAGIHEMEAVILEAVDRKQLLTPDDVRGTSDDLRTALMTTGWPELEHCQGKIMLALDNEGSIRDEYSSADPQLKNRLIFPSAKNAEEPTAGWFKVNDAKKDFDKIQRLVKAGFLVRTRADISLKEGRNNDSSRRDQAFASGAQFVSTDFPEARKEIGPYRVRFSDDQFVRANPLLLEPAPTRDQE
ncbi:Ca2+-dependent phosphoinositide-specific phospholipase C [Haloferula chungangensis]|uniref:Ca2+-dependent phosphoinositide-specific phospholipase C n=1 Tax=Haloferula chungangensis TaxID=1048331 RepID=A0ABW2L8M1_9BACT